MPITVLKVVRGKDGILYFKVPGQEELLPIPASFREKVREGQEVFHHICRPWKPKEQEGK